MKKFTVSLLMVIILCVFPILLVSCTKSIEFTNEPLKTNLNRDLIEYLDIIKAVKSTEDLENFKNNKQFENAIISGFEKFDDKYFESSTLIIVSLLVNTEIEITKVTKKQKELLVYLNIKPFENESNEYYTFAFISIKNDELKNVSKYSYVAKTIHNDSFEK